MLGLILLPHGKELTRRSGPGKVEGLPRTGLVTKVAGSDGVRRLFENSTVRLIVNAKLISLVGSSVVDGSGGFLWTDEQFSLSGQF